MDIGANTAPTPISDDEARLAAATKRVVLQPLSTEVAAEAPSDARIAAEHVNGAALANAPTDTERTVPTTPAVAPTDHRSGHALAFVLTSAVLVTAGGALYFVLQMR